MGPNSQNFNNVQEVVQEVLQEVLQEVQEDLQVLFFFPLLPLRLPRLRLRWIPRRLWRGRPAVRRLRPAVRRLRHRLRDLRRCPRSGLRLWAGLQLVRCSPAVWRVPPAAVRWLRCPPAVRLPPAAVWRLQPVPPAVWLRRTGC